MQIPLKHVTKLSKPIQELVQNLNKQFARFNKNIESKSSASSNPKPPSTEKPLKDSKVSNKFIDQTLANIIRMNFLRAKFSASR